MAKNRKELDKLFEIQKHVIELDEDNNRKKLLRKVNNLIVRQKRLLGWALVYRIADGQASDLLFEGTDQECVDFVIDHPELKGNCIINPIYSVEQL